MKKLVLFPVLILAAVACSEDDRDDVRETVKETNPLDCKARCEGDRDDCVKACTDDDCRTGCSDRLRACEVDCDD